jgi:hypothetical protein
MNIQSIIQETYNRANPDNKDYPSILLTILKEKHLWPYIKIKKFKNDKNLCLLHNSYKRDDVIEFKELYDECRSIILDFSKSIGNNVVINYAHSIPQRLSIENYVNNNYNPNDECYLAMDGTLITTYFHNGTWFFGSSCCPDINSSKFSHPSKTHGYMLDEALYEIYKNNVNISDVNISATLRNLFTSNLSPLYSYVFILLHHENKHIIDYKNELGDNFKLLFHINTKNRLTLIDEDISSKPLEYLGIRYPLKFLNVDEAIKFVSTNENSFIIKRNNQLIKVANNKSLHLEEVHSNNHNMYYNILYVYMLQKPNYSIIEYINEFYPSNTFSTNPQEEINLLFMTMSEVIYNLYIATTNYYPKYKRFKVNLDVDKTLTPVIRFHLAQLRNQQVKSYTKAIITKQEVFNYLCHTNNIKNIKKLILHFSTTNIYNIPNEIIEVFKRIQSYLSN